MSDRGTFANRFSQRDTTVTAPDVGAQQTGVGPYLLGSDHQGASSAPGRSYVYWRSPDTRRQITALTDKEINRRIDFLYHHFGFCRRLIHGCAKLCGILTPQPDTPAEDWNEEAFDVFNFSACSPEIYDQGAHFDFYGGQIMTNINRFLRGRSLAVLTETASGRASHAFYEAHQIDHQWEDADGEKIRQGVLINRFSRHLAYFLRDGEKPGDKPKRYDAQDCLYFGKFENHGQTHPLSILAFAVVNMLDVVEVRGHWKSAIKSTATRGEVIEQDGGQKIVSTGGGGIHTVPVVTTRADGSEEVVQKRMIYGDGSEVLKLDPGQKLRVVTDDRPSAQNLEFERALMEDCAHGVDLDPSALMYVAGKTGPAVRFSMEDINRWILLQHLWQARKCHAIYTRIIAKEIKAGRLSKPMHKGQPVQWWRPNMTQWIGLPSVTIDRGNAAKSSVIRLDVGLATWGDTWAAEGAFWKKKLNSRILEVAFAKRRVWEESKLLRDHTDGEVGLEYEEVISLPNRALLDEREENPPTNTAPTNPEE